MNLENNFFKIIQSSNNLYKLEPYLTPSNKTNTNIILHKKLLNTYKRAKSKPSLNSESFLNEKVSTTPTIEPKIKNEKNKNKKNQ